SMVQEQITSENTQPAIRTTAHGPRTTDHGPRVRVLDEAGFLSLPRPEWLVEGWLVRDALNLLSGRGGGGKSFLALDLALRVATGRDWHGHALAAGPVIYIAAEGAGEIVQR